MRDNNSKPIRVVLIDDALQIHKMIATLLEGVSDIELVGDGANGEDALNLCEQLHPDIILIDVMMPVMDGIESTRQLHVRFPDLKILVLSSFQDHESVHAMLNSGATGYITKTSLMQDLVVTIRATYQGKMVFSSEIVSQMMQSTDESKIIDFHLTQRELEVLAFMAQGLNMADIAEKLYISQSTVKFHIGNICTKLKVPTRSEALIVAAKNKLV